MTEDLFIMIDNKLVKIIREPKVFHTLNSYMVEKRNEIFTLTSKYSPNVVGELWYYLQESVVSPVNSLFIPNKNFDELILEEKSFSGTLD